MNEPEVFPLIILDANPSQWTPRDKLARLMAVSQEIGYLEDTFSGLLTERAEQKALFDELAALLEKRGETG